METSNHPINPLLLSWKVRDVRNFELPQIAKELRDEPRLIEVAFFLQWVSEPQNYPGGLARFTADFIEENLSQIGTATIRRCADKGSFTPKDADQAMAELPDWRGRKVDHYTMNDLIEESTSRRFERDKDQSADDVRNEFIENNFPGRLLAEAHRAANDELANFFRSLCEQRNVGFTRDPRISSRWQHLSREQRLIHGAPWYWPTVCADLLDWMEGRAQRTMSEIAETRVSLMVLKWVRRSRECNMPVWLTGSCRFGKTESLRAIAKANPGRYRIVETPDDTSILSLCRAVATALGIQCTTDTALVLRGKIGEVLDASGIMLLIDEAHFLLPTKITRNTRPQRLDFIRRTIIDRGHPVVFISTPQSYLEARRKFEKVTGYTMGQWDGRLLREEPVELPEEIDEQEKLAVAAIHLPGFDADYLKYVVARVSAVRGSSVYAQIAKVAAMSWVVAREHGRKRPSVADIKEASSEVLPSLPNTATPAPNSPRSPKTSAKEFFPAPDRVSSPLVNPPARATVAELVTSEPGG